MKLPRAASLAMTKFIEDKLALFEVEIERLLFPSLIEFAPRAERALVVSRDDVRIPATVASKLSALELFLIDIFDERELDDGLNVIGKRVAKKNAIEIQRVVGISIRDAAPDVADQINNFRAINVSRIKSLAGQELVEITKLLDAREATGATSQVLQKSIRERFDVSRSKARLLARDQILTLNAQITRTRQTNAGIEEYIWTTSGDERVRPEHEEREGKRFRWNTPPEDGHPGEPIQCRCTPFPVLPELA